MENQKVIATKEQRETFNDIMSNETRLKKLNEYPDSIFYIINDSVYMEQDLITDKFYIRYNDFWRVFETKFNLNYQEISELLCCLLEERLKCRVTATYTLIKLYRHKLEERLKCEVNTTLYTMGEAETLLKKHLKCNVN